MSSEPGKKEKGENRNLNLDELIKLFLVLQLSEKFKTPTGNTDCKELKEKFEKVYKEPKILREECKLDLNLSEIRDLVENLKTLKDEQLHFTKLVQDILDKHKKDLMLLVEERSNLVLTDLEEILKHNYESLVKLIGEIHNSLALKMLAALIIFLSGVVVGSWVERFVLHKIVDNLTTELKTVDKIENSTSPAVKGESLKKSE